MINESDATTERNTTQTVDASKNGAGAEGSPSAVIERPIKQSNPWPLLAFMVVWYGFWLWISSEPPARRPTFDFVFNSMFDHLMHGRFDVDPDIVDIEGFLRNGRVYAYWGIFGALLRFPLWLVHRLDVDLTAFSCLVATTIAVVARVRAVLLIRQQAPPNKTNKLATDMMLAYILTGGSATAYLKESIYQEVVFWATAFGSVFVYFAIKGLIQRRFSSSSLRWMALCAGLALLTRVSTGIGLILAFVLLLPVLAAESGTAKAESVPFIECSKRILLALLNRRFLVPLGILGVCVAATGAVNYFRWGNPLTFADYRYYIGNALWPDRIWRVTTYGTFNFRRIPIALLYYFVPIWIVRTPSGSFLFEKAQLRLFDDIELPPSTFLLTDLLALGFILFLVIAIWKHRAQGLPAPKQCAAVAAGLFAPCLLMFMAISLTFRYRMEFYPEFDFLAFLGLYLVLTNEVMHTKFEHSRAWMGLALVVSSISSLAALVLYFMSQFGQAQELLRKGII